MVLNGGMDAAVLDTYTEAARRAVRSRRLTRRQRRDLIAEYRRKLTTRSDNEERDRAILDALLENR